LHLNFPLVAWLIQIKDGNRRCQNIAQLPAEGADLMMKVTGVRRDQHRALWLSTVAFTVCFAVWTIFSIIGVQIKKDLGLNETQFGLLIGTPILTGSLIRLMLGIWTDQYGGRIVYTAVMLSAAVVPAGDPGHGPGHIRRRKCRRSGHEVRGALYHGGLRLEDCRQCLGARHRRHGDHFLARR
jgi:hypothetical protein